MKLIATIEPKDVGQAFIVGKDGKKYHTEYSFGRFMKIDIGKRIFETSNGVLQMENQEQLEARSKQTKHTEGPWIIDTDKSTPNWSTMIRDNQLRQICEINRYVDAKIDGANARLIASCPDLLEALERVIAVSSTMMEDQAEYLTFPTIQKALLLIKKARGES